MAITKDVVAKIIFEVKTEDGVLVDEVTRDHPLDYLHGHQNLIPGLEMALEGKKEGDRFEVIVAPKDAYGEYHDGLVQRVPVEVFGGLENVEVGARFIAETDIGEVPVEITAIDGDEVVVDGNHLLAGQTLTFIVEVLETRAATTTEIEHGHLHQAGGCCGGHEHDHDLAQDVGCCDGHEHAHEHGRCESDPTKECCGGGECGKKTLH